MLTVTFLSQKGGAGKTTLACAIAVAGESAGHATVLIGPRPSGNRVEMERAPRSGNASHHRRLSGPAHRGPQRCARGWRPARGDRHAPHVSDAALEAARAAHMVLIPCRPSAADLTAIGASVELARQAGVPAHAVLNAAPVRNPLTEQAREAIARYGINTVPPSFTNASTTFMRTPEDSRRPSWRHVAKPHANSKPSSPGSPREHCCETQHRPRRRRTRCRHPARHSPTDARDVDVETRAQPQPPRQERNPDPRRARNGQGG